MRRLLHILSNAISALFYPLWIPTYGMLLFCIAVSRMMPLPWNYWLVMLGTTFLATGLLPVALILYQIHSGDIADIYITHREERTLAYVETACCYLAWWAMLHFTLHAPSWLGSIALASSVAVLLVAVINHWWKISAHLTGMGGLLGGIFTFQLITANTQLPIIIIVLALTLCVMYARLYLDAHTPWQVIAGFALGLSCTTLIPLCHV